MSRYFDLSQNAVLFGDTLLPVEAFLTPDTVEAKLVSSVFDFAKNLAELKLTEIQLALYSAFVLLSSGILPFSFLQDLYLFLFLNRSVGPERDVRDPAIESGRPSGSTPGIVANPPDPFKGRHLRGRFLGSQIACP